MTYEQLSIFDVLQRMRFKLKKSQVSQNKR